jgi:hypothetical protein
MQEWVKLGQARELFMWTWYRAYYWWHTFCFRVIYGSISRNWFILCPNLDVEIIIIIIIIIIIHTSTCVVKFYDHFLRVLCQPDDDDDDDDKITDLWKFVTTVYF